MMVLSEEPKLIVSDINIIFKPKPKRAYKSNTKTSPLTHFNRKDSRLEKRQKHKPILDLNLNKDRISKSQNFELISFEEIENDFKKLKASSEIFEVENELISLFLEEVQSYKIAEITMRKLKKIDVVAYIRFASVYYEFSSVEEFMEELRKL